MGPDVKVPAHAANRYTRPPNRLKVRPQQEVHLVARGAQTRAIIAAECPAADHANFHRGMRIDKKRHSACRVPFQNRLAWLLLGAQDGVFGGFGHAELHDLLGWDLDRFTRRWIAS